MVSINRLAVDYINLMTYAMVGVVLIGPEFVMLLASKQYWEGIKIIPPIVLSNYLIFAYTLYVNIEHYHKKTPYITINTVIAACCNILLNYFLIPKFGYVAAAYTTLFSYSVALILHAIYAKRLENELYPLKTFTRPFIHIAVAVLLFYIFINEWYIRWPIAIAYVLLMIYRERMKLIKLLRR